MSTCSICYEEITKINETGITQSNFSITCRKCSEEICKNCFKDYLKNSKNIYIICPNCSTQYDEEDVVNLFTEEFSNNENPLYRNINFERIVGFNSKLIYNIMDEIINGSVKYILPANFKQLINVKLAGIYRELLSTLKLGTIGYYYNLTTTLYVNYVIKDQRINVYETFNNNLIDFVGNDEASVIRDKIRNDLENFKRISLNKIEQVFTSPKKHFEKLDKLKTKTDYEAYKKTRLQTIADIEIPQNCESRIRISNGYSITSFLVTELRHFAALILPFVNLINRNEFESFLQDYFNNITKTYISFYTKYYGLKISERINPEVLSKEISMKRYITKKIKDSLVDTTVNKNKTKQTNTNSAFGSSIFKCDVCCIGYHDVYGDNVCILCNQKYCKRCNCKIGEEEHKCNKTDVDTLETMIKESKACPTCQSRIFKITGCDDMFCTFCKTGFSWTNGRIIKHHFHNPERENWLNNKTKSFGIDASEAQIRDIMETNSISEIMNRIDTIRDMNNEIKHGLSRTFNNISAYSKVLRKEVENNRINDSHGFTLDEYILRIQYELFKLRSKSFDFKDKEVISNMSKAITINDLELKTILDNNIKENYIKEFICREKVKLLEITNEVINAFRQFLIEIIIASGRSNFSDELSEILSKLEEMILNYDKTINSTYTSIFDVCKKVQIEPKFYQPVAFDSFFSKYATVIYREFKIDYFFKLNSHTKLFKDINEFNYFVEKFIEHVMYISNNKTEYESRLKEIKQELWKNTSYRRIDSALRKKISTLYDIIRRINLQIPLFLLDTNETIELLKYEEDPTDIRVINAFMENANRVRIRVQM